MKITFEDICNQLPQLLKDLLSQQKYPLKELTEGRIKTILNSNKPVAGVYVISQNNIPVYVGRSGNLAQRIGTDHRAIQKMQATLGFKLTTLDELPEITTMREARDYMYKNFCVQIVRIDDDNARAIFEIYASMQLNTKYNTFREH